MDEVEITVVGAGVVGLAVAAGLSGMSDSVIVLERREKFGQETSSRNSEVIHSGIYYPPESLKARLCVEGAARLYRSCESNAIPFRKPGKLIIATEEAEIERLNELVARGNRNGVRGLMMLGSDEIRQKEPRVKALAGISVPDTGIVDSHSLMNHLYRVAHSAGVTFSFSSEVNGMEKEKDGYVVGIAGDDYRFRSKVVINSAGLFSDRVAEMAGIDVKREGYALQYCKGSYFSYGGKSPVSTLVYPAPHEDLKGLGVHATLNLAGRLRFGPDAEYVDSIDYRIDINKRDAFHEGASRFIEGLEKDAFLPDTAGIRPKIRGEGIKDFVIRHEADRGLEGFINLVGIESPGLTACLAIAKEAAELVKEAIA